MLGVTLLFVGSIVYSVGEFFHSKITLAAGLIILIVGLTVGTLEARS